jgi:hypothetical protein
MLRHKTFILAAVLLCLIIMPLYSTNVFAQGIPEAIQRLNHIQQTLDEQIIPKLDQCNQCPECPGCTVGVPKTGQTTTYALGDDGDLQKGVASPNPRFTDNGDGTITDNLTGLIWLKNANCPGGTLTWYGALDFVAGINSGANNCADISKAGDNQTDWRLPNIRELYSLVDYSHINPALPFPHPFTNFSGHRMLYWSSTSYALDPTVAFVLDFVQGNVGAGFNKSSSDGNYGFVTAVRGGSN